MTVRATVVRRSLGALCAAAAVGSWVALAAPAASAARPGHPPKTVGTAAGTPAPAAAAVPTGAPVAAGSPATCSPANLGAVQAYVNQGLSNRVTQLGALSSAVSGANDLSAADRGTLTADVASEQSGIQALVAKLPGDTTCQAVIADGRAMVVDFRVYVVMTPQVHLTVSADTESALAAEMAGLEPKLQAAINSAEQAGRNGAAAQALFTGFQAQVVSAAQASSGISAQVLAFTPASYPGSWATFRADRATLDSGRVALHQADADLHKIIAALG